jgi:hypothetical protein
MSTDGNYKENKNNNNHLQNNKININKNLRTVFADDDKAIILFLSNLKTPPRNENLKKI